MGSQTTDQIAALLRQLRHSSDGGVQCGPLDQNEHAHFVVNMRVVRNGARSGLVRISSLARCRLWREVGQLEGDVNPESDVECLSENCSIACHKSGSTSSTFR